MSEQTTFGKRRAPLEPVRSAPPSVDEGLSPAAEAFRAQLGVARQEASPTFEQWRRGRQRRLMMVWLLRIAFLSPGILGAALKANWELSAGLEVAGLAASWWLRQERRNHRVEVLAWADANAPSDMADLTSDRL